MASSARTIHVGADQPNRLEGLDHMSILDAMKTRQEPPLTVQSIVSGCSTGKAVIWPNANWWRRLVQRLMTENWPIRLQWLWSPTTGHAGSGIDISSKILFSMKPRDWLRRTSPKWPILCWMLKTFSQSLHQSGRILLEPFCGQQEVTTCLNSHANGSRGRCFFISICPSVFLRDISKTNVESSQWCRSHEENVSENNRAAVISLDHQTWFANVTWWNPFFWSKVSSQKQCRHGFCTPVSVGFFWLS